MNYFLGSFTCTVYSAFIFYYFAGYKIRYYGKY
jgi:hypothetical protein